MAPPKITMRDIALRAGVSKNTVSLALKNDPQISVAVREQIKKIADRMGYQRNPTVSHLMAELSRTRRPGFKASLAILNANPDLRALINHPTLPTYVRGCRQRAEELGYSVDHFWLQDPELPASRLAQIFEARDIRGAIIVGLTKTKHLPSGFDEIWQRFPAVVTGVRTENPTLSFACVDHHMLAARAFEKAIEFGYRRPALVLDQEINEVVDGRFFAGVQIAQQHFSGNQRVKAFYLVGEPPENRKEFYQWFKREKPDIIFTLYNVIRHWLEDIGVYAPKDIGLLQLEWRKSSPYWAGMNQHNDEVGKAAVEMVINMIHNHSPGIPEFPLATLIGSTWMDGTTIRHQSAIDISKEPAAA